MWQRGWELKPGFSGHVGLPIGEKTPAPASGTTSWSYWFEIDSAEASFLGNSCDRYTDEFLIKKPKIESFPCMRKESTNYS